MQDFEATRSLEQASLALGSHGERVTSLSDALFSIIATITTLPLVGNLSEDRKFYEAKSSVAEALNESKMALLYCLLTFNIVSRMHLFHCVIFDKVKRAGLFVVCVNSIFLFFVSLIPMGQALLGGVSAIDTGGSLEKYTQSAIFFVVLLSCIRFSGAILVYCLPYEQHDRFRLCLRRRRIAQESFGGLLFSLLAPLPAYLFEDENKDWGVPLFFACAAVSYKLSKQLSLVVLRRYYKYGEDMVQKTRHHTAKRYNRSRVDNYSDGVMSISATLIVLDISSCRTFVDGDDDNDRTSESYNDCRDVLTFLERRKSQLAAYTVSFILICALVWVRHSSMWRRKFFLF